MIAGASSNNMTNIKIGMAGPGLSNNHIAALGIISPGWLQIPGIMSPVRLCSAASRGTTGQLGPRRVASPAPPPNKVHKSTKIAAAVPASRIIYRKMSESVGGGRSLGLSGGAECCTDFLYASSSASVALSEKESVCAFTALSGGCRALAARLKLRVDAVPASLNI